MKAGSCAIALLAAGLLAWLGLPAWAQGRADAPPLGVWELPKGAGAQLAPADLDARKGWKLLDPDAARPEHFPDGLAVENPHLLVVLPAGGRGVAVFTKAKGKARYIRQDLVLADAQGPVDPGAPGLGSFKLTEYGQDRAVVSFAAGAVQAAVSVPLAGPFVEVRPGQGARGLRVLATARLSFLPDFFGNDVLYDATQTGLLRLFVPADNFVVNLLDGHAAMTMLSWPPGGGEEVLLLPEDFGPDRRFAATQVSFNGKSVFVSVLAGEGVWFSTDLAKAPKDKTFVVEGWQPPFAAKWMTILVKRPAVGAKDGIASQSLAVRDLPPAGDTPYSDVYVHPWVPSWFSGREWRLHLQTELQHMMTRAKVQVPEPLLAVNYPRDRLEGPKGTPPEAFTLVDVMRGTLGVGPCKFVLDLEGLNKTRSTGAAGTGKPTAAATCAERGALVYYYLGDRAEASRREATEIAADAALESVEKIKDFLDAAHARIQEYLAWSKEVIQVAEAAQAGAKSPAVKELADRVIPIARQMQQLWDTMAEEGKPCAFPTEWRMALDHCKDLIRTGAPDLGARARAFDPQMRGAGEEVDGGMQACRMIVKRVRQEAALAGSADPETLKLASEIRRRCRGVLVNKHYKEGDSVRLSGQGSAK